MWPAAPRGALWKIRIFMIYIYIYLLYTHKYVYSYIYICIDIIYINIYIPYWRLPIGYSLSAMRGSLSLCLSLSLSLYIYIDIFIHTISMCIALVNQWREVSKVRKQGAIPPQPAGSKIGFISAFHQWLEERSP